MTYKPTMAEAQAMGLCYLARQSGLPDVHILRSAVSQLHTTTCGWCDYPLPSLLEILREFNGRRDDEDRDEAIEFEEHNWWVLPPRAKRAAIRAAQGNPA